MARDGAGNYSNPYPDFVPGTTIESSQVDANFSDVATALTASLAKDGQTVPTANLPMGGFKHTGVGAASALTHYARADQVVGSVLDYAADTGTATAYAIAPTPGIAAYVVGQSFKFKAANANSGADPTLAVNSLTAGIIYWPNGDSLVAGDIPDDALAEVIVATVTTGTPTFHLQTVGGPGRFLRPTILTAKGDTLVANGASISAITQANPGVVTTTVAHGLTTGDTGTFENISGMTQLNGRRFTVTVASSTTFSIGIDTSAFTAYTSGGNVLISRRKAIGSNGTVAMARSASPIGMADVAPFSGHITGLTYANNVSDATNDIDIAAGGCMDATNAYWIALSAITKRLDASWAVGTNQGGLDTGSIADTDYFIWAIARSDTGVTDALFSASATSPTMPANYDYKRLIGWFRRASSAILAFKVYETAGGGIDFLWAAPTLEIDDTLSTSRRTDAVKVPAAFPVMAQIRVHLADASNNVTARICNPDEADIAVSGSAVSLGNALSQPGATATDFVELRVRTSATGTIAARAAASLSTYKVSTIGFEWSRR